MLRSLVQNSDEFEINSCWGECLKIKLNDGIKRFNILAIRIVYNIPIKNANINFLFFFYV